METILNKILAEIDALADEEKSKHLCKFFKTGKGQYGEGDIFLGINVPTIRSIAKKYYSNVSLDDIQKLIESKYHEIRLLALFLSIFIYEKTEKKEEIFNLYIKNLKYINNWDLVDLSAPKIIGRHVFDSKDYSPIYKLAESRNLWAERISVVATHYFIKREDFSLILRLSEKFLTHKHDLIQKAVGWMLREMGKIDEKPLCEFLDKHHKIMPRTMLRYSLERLSIAQKKYYM